MKTEFRTTSVPLRSDDTNLMIAAIQIGLRPDCLLHPRNLSLMIGRSSNQDDCYQAESCLRLADVTGSTLHIRHCRLKLERQQRVDLRLSQTGQKLTSLWSNGNLKATQNFYEVCRYQVSPK
jgi:hypothetical protein